MRDPSVNIAPLASHNDLTKLWDIWLASNATAEFNLDRDGKVFQILRHAAAMPVEPEEGEERVAITAPGLADRAAWRSVPRKIEPGREFKLTAEVRGSGRVSIQWVRIEKHWESLKDGSYRYVEIPLTEALGRPVLLESSWVNASVGDVAPRDASHCRILLEAVGSAPATEFREVFLDGLGNDPLEIQYCHPGYHPEARKTIVVQVLNEARNGSFSLIDRNGVEVFEEELEPLEHDAWGRSFWRADFTDFKEEGTYALVASIAGLRRRTKYFTISRNVYGQLSELTLHWFHAQRCGRTILDWHDACHTDDGVIRAKDGTTSYIDATGGWHASGGYEKMTDTLWVAIHALTHMYEKAGGRTNELGGLLPDALEECRWGVEYLLKIATDDGRYAAYVQPEPHDDYVGPPEHETDNRLQSGDERVVGPPCKLAVAAMNSYSLANFGRVVQPFDKGLAERCFAAAEKTFALFENKRKDEDTIYFYAAAALLSISLWRAKGKERYREECSWRILSILQRQKQEGIFTDIDEYLIRATAPLEVRVQVPRMTEHHMGMEYAPAPFLYLHALLCYLERSIDDALALEIRGALDKFLLRIKEAAGVSPFGQLGEFILADDPVNFPVMDRGHNTYYLASTYLLAKAAALLDRPDLANLAQKQYEWVLGRNIRGVCMLCGAGHKGLGAYYTKIATNPLHKTGYIGGGVVNGIIGGNGSDYPIDFPQLDIHYSGEDQIPEGLDSDPRTNEYWLPNSAWFILASGELTKNLPVVQ